ncbi:hypothetical protein Tco_0615403 [Tanacetum coccineum]
MCMRISGLYTVKKQPLQNQERKKAPQGLEDIREGDERNHLRKQVEDMLKAGKLSHIIRDLKQNSGKEQPKKKGETSRKEKPQAILMIQSRQNAQGWTLHGGEINVSVNGTHRKTRGVAEMKAVPSTTHGMIKFLVMRGILTLRSSKIIPIEYAMVFGPEDQPPLMNKVKEERIKVAINPEHPEQTVMIGSDLTEKNSSDTVQPTSSSLEYSPGPLGYAAFQGR